VSGMPMDKPNRRPDPCHMGPMDRRRSDPLTKNKWVY
jgi:hypothetical protein